MDIILNRAIKSIATVNLLTVSPNVIMTEIAEIFNSYEFHHIPVIEEDKPVGIISKSDFYRLQHHFTQLGLTEATDNNRRFFESIIANDVMTKNPVCLKSSDMISDAVDIFLKNKVHSILICDNEKCTGIITPYDILKTLVEPALIEK